MSRTGRPSKLTPELSAALCGQLAEGLSRTRAAQLVGVSKKSVCAWLKLGRTGRSERHARFLVEVLAAEAAFVASLLAVVVRAAWPPVERVAKTTTRPDGSESVEVMEKQVPDWRVAAGV